MKTFNNIPGLYIEENIITLEIEKQIIQWIDSNNWSDVLSRRTQHYGYIYDYKKTYLEKGVEFNGWVNILSEWLKSRDIMKVADQCIVNEYKRDQCIGKHIDGKRGNKENIFGPKIISISCGEETNMIFCNLETNEKVEIEVPRRCMLIMTEESRYKWTHEIPRRKYVIINGKKTDKEENYRRISLTFRNIISIKNNY